MLKFLKSKRRLLLILIDICIIVGVYFVAYLLDNGLKADRLTGYLLNFLCFTSVLLVTRFLAGAYSNMWRYANAKAFLEITLADIGGGVVALVVSVLIKHIYIGGWRSIAIISMIDCLTLLSRFVYQQYHKTVAKSDNDKKDSKITVAIVGAGQVGALLAEELLCYRASHYRPVCFVDQNETKVGGRVAGLPVLGEDDELMKKLAEYPVQEIIIAIPRLSGERLQKMYEYYRTSGCKVKIYDFPAKDTEVQEQKRVIREFRIEDLLFRDAINVTDDKTREYYRDKIVLVTGGGGSIGSELCRQIARCSPRKLIIFDIYENNAYDIQQELIRRYKGALNLSVEIGSVRDRDRLDAVFAYYRPNVVFHAAAHKHVPLMEHSNCEAIKNNCLGTYNTADMAEKYGVSKFILVSTDKAVNPTNVMGASKRMCEMIVQCRNDGAHSTAFCAVRFGNVLGSNGSVIPLFKNQIAQGGPITLTDMRIIRYFMTIPEASGLVMTAGAMAKSGELFVLDMGKPVKIYDLAENMIRLSGLRPHVDIPIIETGLRPGEKLYEELLIKTETLQKTDNNLIFIEKDEPLSREAVEQKLDILRAAVKENENAIAAPAITEAMKSVVPTFHSPEEVNRLAERSEEMKMVNGPEKAPAL